MRTQAVDEWERREVYGATGPGVDEWFIHCRWCDETFTSNSRLVVTARALGHALWEHYDQVKRREFRRR